MKTCPVIWRSEYEIARRRWRKWMVIMTIAFLILSLQCFSLIYNNKQSTVQYTTVTQELNSHRIRHAILVKLRARGVSLAQGLDIADSLMIQSRKNGVPLAMGLAIIDKESEFFTNAISNKGAVGLMQILPSTFEMINKNLKLGLRVADLHDPVVNIRIGMIYLGDLIAMHKKTTKSEEEMWIAVLNTYSHFAHGYPQAVLRLQRHIENEESIRDGEV